MTMAQFQLPTLGRKRPTQEEIDAEDLVEYNGVWMTKNEARARLAQDAVVPGPNKLIP